MNNQTLLLRQIHPTWIKQGSVTSQAFRPTPKDDNRLSCDDGDQISPEDSWRRFTEDLGNSSTGILAASSGECEELELLVDPDAEPYPEHVSIVFENLSNRQKEKKAKQLRSKAMERGWCHGPGLAGE